MEILSFWQHCQLPAGLLLVCSTLLLGLRHGLDFDHLAAIADMTAARVSLRQGLLMASCYALGHAVVVLLLGFLAVMVGFTLPSWIDEIMEPVVGITLIALSAWLILSIFVQGERFRLRSRFGLFLAAIQYLRLKFSGCASVFPPGKEHRHLRDDGFSYLSCLSIGVAHGIGAETPTQILTLGAVGAFRGQGLGVGMLLAFVSGIFISNMAVAVLSLTGYRSAAGRQAIGIGLGILTALFSLLVGAAFLFKHASLLPSLS